MGTFHDDLGELHGITVVVDTTGPRIYIGRCHEETASGILLLDVDVHEDGENGQSKDDFVRRAAKFGVWKKHERFLVPSSEVTSIRRLGNIDSDPGP